MFFCLAVANSLAQNSSSFFLGFAYIMFNLNFSLYCFSRSVRETEGSLLDKG